MVCLAEPTSPDSAACWNLYLSVYFADLCVRASRVVDTTRYGDVMLKF